MDATKTQLLKDLQGRVKKITSSREALLTQAGSEQRKLEEAYEKLRELGIKEPEKLTAKQLTAKLVEFENELDVRLKELQGHVQQGETLLAEYQGAQEI